MLTGLSESEFNTSTLDQLLISNVEYSLLLFTLVKNNETLTPSISILFSNTDSKYEFLYPLSSVTAILILVTPEGLLSFIMISPAAGFSEITKDFTLYTEPGNVNLLATISPITLPASYMFANLILGSSTIWLKRVTYILAFNIPDMFSVLKDD